MLVKTNNLNIHPFLILPLILFIFPISAVAGQLSRFSLRAGALHIEATIYRQGQGFGETEVLSFRSSPDGKLLLKMKSDGFETPVLFHYHGENFVHVSTTPDGSGGFVTDTIFWIAPDATMHEIGFESAAKAYEDKAGAEETVLTGGNSVNCTGGKLKFEFYVANNGDPHCCPTAGKVTGNYEIIGKKKFDPITSLYSSTFKMMAKQYSRTPISPGEISANFTR